MDKKTLIIADDHIMVREGFKLALAGMENLVIAGEASNGEECVRLAEKLRPDIIVMDIDMPVMNGIEASKKIKQIDENIKILILTMMSDESYVFNALSAGIDGYIYKMSPLTIFKEAVRLISEGEPYFSREVTNIIVKKKFGETDKKESKLTQREKEILKLIAQGETSKEIAEKLFLSYFTVTTHRKNILEKLQVKNTAELIKFALSSGIV